MNDCCKMLLLDLAKKINKASEEATDFKEDADMSNGPPPLTEEQFGMMKAYLKVMQIIEEIGEGDDRFTGLSIKRVKDNG